MNDTSRVLSRRGFLGGAAILGAGVLAWREFFDVPGLYAQELARTPRMTEGPFYPDRLPLDTDNDLIVINDSITPAVGDITNVTGRILTPAGSPINNAVVEIWQVDHNGAYLHSGTTNANRRDRNFQGFGRFTTGERGEYRFRTVKPVPYPGRTPHIHFKVKRGERTLLDTQLFIAGHPQNARDGLYRSLGGIVERELVTVEFRPVPDTRPVQYNAVFDIVLGVTPAEPDPDRPAPKDKK